MSRPFLPLALTLCVLMAATGGEAVAQQRERDAGPQRQQSSRGDLSDSVRRVERNTGGQVLSAEQIPFNGRNVNRIKVMDERGRVRVVMDEPQQRGERRSGSRRDDD